MDPVARDIWEASKPHAPAALLAYLARENLPFPSTGVPMAAPGLDQIIAISGWTVARYGPEYLLFRCPECRTSMYQPASQTGMTHALRVARKHKVPKRGTGPICCDQRAALDQETIWPDSLVM